MNKANISVTNYNLQSLSQVINYLEMIGGYIEFFDDERLDTCNRSRRDNFKHRFLKSRNKSCSLSDFLWMITYIKDYKFITHNAGK